MCPLFETVRIAEGIPLHLSWHQRRMDMARNEYWPGNHPIALHDLLVVPAEFSTGIVHCNIRYGAAINDITFSPYSGKIIRSLKIVYADLADYHVKFMDRTFLETLLSMKGDCDEILIVKNGLITDTSMSNIIFYNGTAWFTPEKPLLKGTCRERLLAEGSIEEMDIHTDDLCNFTCCQLINAMRFPEETETIGISNIIA